MTPEQREARRSSLGASEIAAKALIDSLDNGADLPQLPDDDDE